MNKFERAWAWHFCKTVVNSIDYVLKIIQGTLIAAAYRVLTAARVRITCCRLIPRRTFLVRPFNPHRWVHHWLFNPQGGLNKPSLCYARFLPIQEMEAIMRVKVFVDFWNFQLRWNDVMNVPVQQRIAWRVLPSVLLAELPTIFGAGETFTHKGTYVFASVNPRAGSRDEGLKKFLYALNQATGFQVISRERRPKNDECPHCNKQIERMIEKGVDSSIVTALYEGAINDAYDVALLLSSDSDYVPAVKTIQDRLNKQIIHVGFRRGGNEVRSAAWSHVILDGELANRLIEGGSNLKQPPVANNPSTAGILGARAKPR